SAVRPALSNDLYPVCDVPVVPEPCVGAEAAGEEVVFVVAFAVEDVVAVFAVEGVAARAAEEGVVAAAAVEEVVAAVAAEEVGGGGAHDPVVAGAADDVLVVAAGIVALARQAVVCERAEADGQVAGG